MYFELTIYVLGASLAVINILQGYPWRRTLSTKLFLTLLSGISLIFSGLGGAFGVARLFSEASTQGAWVAVPACTALFFANLAILFHKANLSYKIWKARDLWTVKSLQTSAGCLIYGDFQTLGAILEKENPGFIYEEDMLQEAIEFWRTYLKDEIIPYLDKLRPKSPARDYEATLFLKRQLDIAFILSLCCPAYSDLKPQIIARLSSVAVALACDGKALGLRLTDLPTGWELPRTEGGTRCSMENVDYRKMIAIQPKTKYHKCDLCDGFWKMPWFSKFLNFSRITKVAKRISNIKFLHTLRIINFLKLFEVFKSTCHRCGRFRTLVEEAPLDAETGRARLEPARTAPRSRSRTTQESIRSHESSGVPLRRQSARLSSRASSPTRSRTRYATG